MIAAYTVCVMEGVATATESFLRTFTKTAFDTNKKLLIWVSVSVFVCRGIVRNKRREKKLRIVLKENTNRRPCLLHYIHAYTNICAKQCHILKCSARKKCTSRIRKHVSPFLSLFCIPLFFCPLYEKCAPHYTRNVSWEQARQKHTEIELFNIST